MAAAADGDLAACEALGRQLVSGAPVTSAEFSEGLSHIERAADGGALSATVLLGHLYSQYPSLPEAPLRAAQCYQRAAEAGHPEALMRLVDLYQFGYGVPIDDKQAYARLAELANAGFAAALCHMALLKARGVGCEASEESAADLILRAAAQGDTLAFALLAERYLTGQGVPRRPDLAWAWLDLAVRRKFPGAPRRAAHWAAGSISSDQQAAGAAIAQQLMANIRQLGGVLAGLTVTETHPDYPAVFAAAVAANFGQLEMPALALDAATRGSDVDRHPSPALVTRALAWHPRVFVIDQFADVEERCFLLAAAGGSLVSTEAQRATGANFEIDEFDGSCAVFAPHLVTPVVRLIQRRWASVLHLAEQHFEPMSILRYERGHEYSPHVDFFDAPRMLAHRAQGDYGGQRLITGLVYLITPDGGGETVYPEAQITVQGKDGLAVLHYNTTPDGLADTASIHSGRPIEAGEKWLCRTAVRERNLYRELETVL